MEIEIGTKNVDIEKLRKGKNPEQKKVISYFLDNERCCFGEKVTDKEIDEIVQAKTNELSKNMVFGRLGIAEEHVTALAPVQFKGYVIDNAFVKKGKDGVFRSSRYQVSWLFFSNEQVYFYQKTFSLIDDSKKENIEEYFYKDITSFSSLINTEQYSVYDKNGEIVAHGSLDSQYFALTVPGEKMLCATGIGCDNVIRGMKELLREKKNE
ncbi:MAG: hypothetical protein IKT03_03830 [Muribaculaceae bacterium]|nr:hypothetical protein [Muribaculaceae bacterium]